MISQEKKEFIKREKDNFVFVSQTFSGEDVIGQIYKPFNLNDIPFEESVKNELLNLNVGELIKII